MISPGEHDKLVSPEYWDGIDIGDPAPFAEPPRMPVHLTVKEHRAAGVVLASCLDDVMSNQHIERDLKVEETFDPTESELGDGTVLILDKEHLSMWTYPPGNERDWKEPDPAWPDTPPIGSDYVGMWRGRQPYGMDDQHFGDERVVFAEDKIIYSRLLTWAVLLTRRNKNRDRFLATWAFAAPKAGPGGIDVPISDDVDFMRTAKRLPLTVGQTVPDGDLHTPTFGIRAMERVKKIKIVHAATAEYEPEEEKSGALSSAKARLGKIFVPEPQHSAA